MVLSRAKSIWLDKIAVTTISEDPVCFVLSWDMIELGVWASARTGWDPDSPPSPLRCSVIAIGRAELCNLDDATLQRKIARDMEVR